MFKVNRKHQSVPLKQVVPLRHVITCFNITPPKRKKYSFIHNNIIFWILSTAQCIWKTFQFESAACHYFCHKCDSNSLLQYNNQTCVEVHKKFFEEQKLHFCLGHHFLLASGTQPRKFINQVISTQNIQTSKIQYNKL